MHLLFLVHYTIIGYLECLYCFEMCSYIKCVCFVKFYVYWKRLHTVHTVLSLSLQWYLVAFLYVSFLQHTVTVHVVFVFKVISDLIFLNLDEMCVCQCLSLRNDSGNCWSHHHQTWHGDHLRHENASCVIYIQYNQGHTDCICIKCSNISESNAHQICSRSIIFSQSDDLLFTQGHNWQMFNLYCNSHISDSI